MSMEKHCFFGKGGLEDFHWASTHIQVTRLQGKHQAKSTDEGAGDYQELEPSHTIISVSWNKHTHHLLDNLALATGKKERREENWGKTILN